MCCTALLRLRNLDDFQQPFEEAWDREVAKAAFSNDENPDDLKREAAVLSRKYLGEVAPEIEPAGIKLPVTGTIGGVPARGVIDLLDVHGCVTDLKTAKKSPSGVSANYAFQVATYRQLNSKASGAVRLDTLVANKTPKIVTMAYTVSEADLKFTQTMYPQVREGMRPGLDREHR